MKISVRHTLTFSLGTPARAVQHVLLTPRATPQQKVEHWSIEMRGFAEAAVFRDAFGNRAQLVSQIKPEETMTVNVTGTVESIDKAGVLGRLEFDPMPALFRRTGAEGQPDPKLIEGLSGTGDRVALFHELMDRVNIAVSAPAQTQAQGGQSQSQGVVENPMDFANAFVGSARALGVPARYVTGYLLGEGGAASFHAWAEGWDDGLGWVSFDAMFNVCPADDYVRVASGLDATTTMPIRPYPRWSVMPDEVVEMKVVK